MNLASSEIWKRNMAVTTSTADLLLPQTSILLLWTKISFILTSQFEMRVNLLIFSVYMFCYHQYRYSSAIASWPCWLDENFVRHSSYPLLVNVWAVLPSKDCSTIKYTFVAIFSLLWKPTINVLFLSIWKLITKYYQLTKLVFTTKLIARRVFSHIETAQFK